MRQKAIWMLLLLIGILNSFQSCKGEIDEAKYEEYCFINESDHVITIEAFFYEKTDSGYANTINNGIYVHRLRQGSTFCQRLELLFGNAHGYLFYADSAVVTFGDTVEISFLSRAHLHPDTTHQPFNILDNRSYTYSKESDNLHNIEYVFTNDDYENAL